MINVNGGKLQGDEINFFIGDRDEAVITPVKIDGKSQRRGVGKIVIRNNNEKARENVVVLAASGGVTRLLFKGAIGCINIYLV